MSLPNESRLSSLTQSLTRACDVAAEHSRGAVDNASALVRSAPIKALGLAVLVGLATGLLARSRQR